VVVADAIRIVQLPPAAPSGAEFVGNSHHRAGIGSLLAFASAAHNEHGDLHASPLPGPASQPAQASASHNRQSDDAYWNRNEDVRPESDLLEEAASLLSSLRSPSGDEASEAAVDQLLAATWG
jgi:hypothetical protein